MLTDFAKNKQQQNVPPNQAENVAPARTVPVVSPPASRPKTLRNGKPPMRNSALYMMVVVVVVILPPPTLLLPP